MKIAYVTAHAPFGRGETFVLEEMLAVIELGVELVIVPRNPPKEVFHDLARQLLDRAIWLPLFNWRIFLSFLKTVALNPRLWRILGRILRHSRTLKILVKNLAVAPKAVFIAGLLRQARVEHIHAHWGSTTATLAFIISQITGIPWSFTLHRWDIKKNNMLKEKVKSSKFVRIISENGKRELLRIIGKNYKEKINVLHMGVKIHVGISEFQKDKNLFIVATPASLVEVKGHKYLIEACTILIEEGIKNFQCIFYGEGPLRTELENFVKEKGLTDYIEMPGAIPHQKLIEMYRNKEIDIVVLPSIITDEGEHEGIPVTLMEAMSYRIPVISTNTGGIPELISDGAGISVEEKSPEQLADAIISVIKNEDLRNEISEKGLQKVKEQFNIEKNVNNLLELIQQSL